MAADDQGLAIDFRRRRAARRVLGKREGPKRARRATEPELETLALRLSEAEVDQAIREIAAAAARRRRWRR